MAAINQIQTDKYALYLGDCCEILPALPSNSIGLSVFSPPFSSLYAYSNNPKDMSNSKSYKQFFVHFEYLIAELFRLMMDGRIVVVHCIELPMFKREGHNIGIRDFPGTIIRKFIKYGFVYQSRICIWKDPLLAAVRTKAIGLAHKQIVKDSAMCRVGIPDSLLCFRKPGNNLKPISHTEGLTEYYGKTQIPKTLNKYIGWSKPSTNKRSHWIWQQYASPVWMDIRQSKVLPFRKGRDKKDQKHICPLQLDVIERCIALWSTVGDTVLTPFMGVGSEVYVAVKNHRKAIGIELKNSYYQQAVTNVKRATRIQKTRSIFE